MFIVEWDSKNDRDIVTQLTLTNTHQGKWQIVKVPTLTIETGKVLAFEVAPYRSGSHLFIYDSHNNITKFEVNFVSAVVGHQLTGKTVSLPTSNQLDSMQIALL